MDASEFNCVLERRILDLRQTLLAKGQEYAYGDRLSNFKDAASFLGTTPQLALFGFVAKHIIALKDFLVEDAKGVHITREMLDEKIGDICCYMILLDALFTEKEKWNGSTKG